jgi:hypothetical protein
VEEIRTVIFLSRRQLKCGTLCAFAQPNQQNKIQREPACFHRQIERQQAAGHDIAAVVKVIDEQMPITRPLRYARPVLKVV